MKTRDLECRIRLVMGLVLNASLWFFAERQTQAYRLEPETWLFLVCGSLAGIILVLVLPVLWRGVAWQRPLALAVMLLPVFAIIAVVQFWEYRRGPMEGNASPGAIPISRNQAGLGHRPMNGIFCSLEFALPTNG